MNDEGDVMFHEEQRFRQPWLWVVFAGGVALEAWLVTYLVAERPAVAVIVGVVVIAATLVPFALLFAAKLVTKVRPDGVHVRFSMFLRFSDHIRSEDVVSCRAVRYRPIRDYGGWGVRFVADGKAYNVSGNRGVRLEFADGRHLLIGSRKPNDLAHAIEIAMSRSR